MTSKQPAHHDTRLEILGGFVGLRIYDTLKGLRRAAGDNTIYARYSYEPNYNRTGVIYLSKESPIQTVVHEVYHAVEHYKRLNQTGLFRDPNGLQSAGASRKEEREALLFGSLVENIVKELNG